MRGGEPMACGQNCALVTAVHVAAQCEKSACLRRQLAAIAAGPQPVPVYFSNFVATRVRLDRLGVRYAGVETLPCPEFITLVGSESQVCVSSSVSRQP